jgi:hypothetical protein
LTAPAQAGIYDEGSVSAAACRAGGFMKKLVALTVISFALALPALAAEWTGYITDTHCGKNGATKDHTAACVEKCMKAGSKAQIWNEADQKIYDLDSFDKVKALMGNKVTVTGTLDAASNTIKVESAAKVSK